MSRRYPSWISKHLMLLFIQLACNCCSIYKYSLFITESRRTRDARVIVVPSITISKHLMLLFIGRNGNVYDSNGDFKTSHVIVYRRRSERDNRKSYISKHLMLLFIKKETEEVEDEWEFQNISCYCLSRAIKI